MTNTDHTSREQPSLRSDSFTIPEHAEALISLAEKIIQQHTSEGPMSPVKPHLIADLNYRVSSAKAKHDQGLKYARLMQEAFSERDFLLGKYINTGKDDRDVKSIIEAVVQVLKQHYPEKADSFVNWGFGAKQDI
ncbi:MAG TPA: hypothetical protein VIN08_15120 [Ohtaekwangia sp.]|uniref:hypothetical protein n=1 Tax=Ohtaekwangia sp. TaxID=2066019 RepID=UPI002F928429